MRTRTPFGLAASGVAVAMLAAACGSPSDAVDDGEQTIELIISNHPWQRGIQPLIPEFEEETGISVNVQTFAEQQARDRIQLNLQSQSDAMDVYMTLPSREGPLFSSSGYYEPLDDYLADAPDEYQADDFSAAALDGMRFDDQVMALPLNVEGPALYYRTDLFEQWGLKPPETVEDLIAVSEEIRAADPDIAPITLRGAAAALPFTFGPFVHGNGVEWTDGEGTPNFDGPGAVQAIEEYATLARDYGPPGVINYSFTESSTLFAQGGAAMELESTNELNSLIDPNNSTVSDNVGVVPVPAGSAGHAPTVLSWGIAMSPHSSNKDAAWEFLQWATSPDIQLRLTEADIAPPRTSVAEDPEYTSTLETEVQQQWGEVVRQLQEEGHTEVGPVGNEAPTMREVIGNEVGAVILEEKSAADAADAIQAELTPLLEDG